MKNNYQLNNNLANHSLSKSQKLIEKYMFTSIVVKYARDLNYTCTYISFFAVAARFGYEFTLGNGCNRVM